MYTEKLRTPPGTFLRLSRSKDVKPPACRIAASAASAAARAVSARAAELWPGGSGGALLSSSVTVRRPTSPGKPIARKSWLCNSSRLPLVSKSYSAKRRHMP